MTRLMAGCVRQTEYPAKRPESNPDVTATTTDRKHYQQKLKRPQEQRQDNNAPKATQTAETYHQNRNRTTNKTTRRQQKTETNQETAKPLKRINAIRN